MLLIPPLDPVAALALGEARAARGTDRKTAWLWLPSRPAAVLGLAQEAERELDLDACRADGLPVLRRSSGGGCVLLSSGTLCFEMLAPPEAAGDLRQSYARLTAPVVAALARFGVEARLRGISDLAAPAPDAAAGPLYKLCGTAQMRKRGAVLVHGSILVDADPAGFGRWLRFPSETPEYRAGRGHGEFCRTVSQLAGRAVDASALAIALRAEAEADGWAWDDSPGAPDAEAERLIGEKYGRDAWGLRRERAR